MTLDVYALLDEAREVLAERRELVMEREQRSPRDAVMPRSDDQHPGTGSTKGFTEEVEDTGLDSPNEPRRDEARPA